MAAVTSTATIEHRSRSSPRRLCLKVRMSDMRLARRLESLRNGKEAPMAPTAERPDTGSLERELHELEKDEAQLRERTSGIERLNVLSFLIALLAFGVAIVAVVLALSNDDNTATDNIMGSSSNPSAMSGAGMMGSRSGATAAPAGVHTV